MKWVLFNFSAIELVDLIEPSEILVDPIELMELCPVERPKVDLNDSTPFFLVFLLLDIDSYLELSAFQHVSEYMLNLTTLPKFMAFEFDFRPI